MNNFTNGAPVTYKEWIEQGYDVTPCQNKMPVTTGWTKEENYVLVSEWKKKYLNHQTGLILNGKTDFDVDNHFLSRFVGKYLESCGAIYGRKSNPLSHYLFQGELKSFKYVMPKELEHYTKDFPHGACLCEIRSGNGHQSIVPSSKINNEQVEWHKFAGINTYDGDLEKDISKIALSGALTILYPSKGARDDYCTAIAGVLSKHTEWSKNEIDDFVYNVAFASGKEDKVSLRERMAKGTTSKEKTFGMPKLAEIVGCNVSTIAKLFSWVGVKDSGSSFTGLRCYTTEPKYWQIEYKGKWITIMESSMLLSYTKMSILILENCYEVAPVILPKDWKTIVAGLLQNVQKIDTPYEASYYGNIGIVFINYCSRESEHKFSITEQYSNGVWRNEEDKHLYFRLEHFIHRLKYKQLSFEMRKMTHFLREEFGAVPTKITVAKKEVRVWKVSEENVHNHQLNNMDISKEASKIGFDTIREHMDEQYKKSKNVF